MRWPRRSHLFPLVLLVLVSGCRRPPKGSGEDAGTPPRGPEVMLTVKGSDTLVILAQRWAEHFMKAHPGARIQVTGGGSGTGIAALINGTTDIAMASRPLEDAERRQVRQKHPQGPVELAVALDGISFYVHESNPVSGLTLAQLKAIYLGDTTRWKDVGGEDKPIVVYSRESSSGTYAYVKERVLGGQDFTERAQTLPGTAAVVNAVSLERHGIGFGGAAYLRGVKALKVGRDAQRAVFLSAETLRDGTYPLARELYFDLVRPPSGLAREFIDHALSPEGQRTVIDAGFFPVK
ncbi:phosphate ABC transporter substrate-binding protein [Melittangium boletus]|uniref:Phosphate-binding protein n=1 Tax=Melittangium boletus DSM 14713 TaxID=1294270 RepID=A0A250IJ60_9BACT|nr:phosphate ABC transporter substrate-binding protein [Melittangium boletus]ATB31859.1 phosphate-binding protein [Melittangium boletus DSM 14713]